MTTRKRGRWFRTLFLGAIYGLTTVVILNLGSYLENYVKGPAVAIAVALNIVTDTAIHYDESLMKYFIERVKPLFIGASGPDPAAGTAAAGQSSSATASATAADPQAGTDIFTLMFVMLLAIICFSGILIGTNYIDTPYLSPPPPTPTPPLRMPIVGP